MKKKDWGNAVWYLFHTLAEKLKPEHSTPAELGLLVQQITSICSNLPCPECQSHATNVMNNVNKSLITASKENLITFLWNFHNSVNNRIKNKNFTNEELSKYKTANTGAVVQHFIKVMSATSNNERTMLNGFHRNLFIKKFKEYLQANHHKFDQ